MHCELKEKTFGRVDSKTQLKPGKTISLKKWSVDECKKIRKRACGKTGTHRSALKQYKVPDRIAKIVIRIIGSSLSQELDKKRVQINHLAAIRLD